MAKITPEEQVQNIQEFIQEDLKFDPPQARRFFTTNIFQRTLAHLVGWTPWGSRMLRCTSTGELKTAPTTTGIESYGATPGTAGDDYEAIPVGGNASRLDIFIWDNPAMIILQLTASAAWGGEFEVPVGFYSIDIRANYFRIKNKTAGQNARYQVIGWW